MPRQAPGSGSITQWIAVCRCDTLVEDANLPVIEVCARCGKRAEAGRAGSLTQWIFRSDICSCETPEPIRTTARPVEAGAPSAATNLPEFEEDMEELEVPPEHFPLERYGPVAKLGQGASGAVYMCKDRLLKKRVAVKVLHNLSPEKLVAFQREAKAISKLSNAGIVKILDFGASASNSPYMVLECLDGISLDQYLRQFGRLDQSTAARVFSKLCEALSYAHKNEIYHRDLKPSNILVRVVDGQIDSVCLIDFGVAQVKNENQEPTIIRGNEVTGTPAYMSPDQILNEPFDSRSEIYSLGCVMFESLIGEPPFWGDTALDTMTMHLNNEPRSLSEAAPALEPEGWYPTLEKIVAKCLEKEPSARYQNFTELHEELKTFRSQMGFVEEETVEKPRSNRRLLLGAAVAAGVVLLVGGQQFFSRAKVSKVASKPIALENRFQEVWSVGRFKDENEGPPRVEQFSPNIKSDEDGEREAGDDDGDRDSHDTANGGKTSKKATSYSPALGAVLNDRDLLLLKGRRVRSLSLSGQRYLKSGAFAALPGLPITRLNVSFTDIGDEALRYIGQLKQIETLNLNGCKKITADGFKYICDLPKLRILHIEGLTVSDKIAPYIKRMSKLEKLFAEGSTGIGDETIKAMETLPLIVVRMTDCDGITDRGLEALEKLPDTSKIEVGSKLVTDKGFEKLTQRFDNIAKIRLDGCTRIGDKSMSVIVRRYPHLKVLRISDTAVTAAGLKEVAKLLELKELRIASMNFTDDDLLPLLSLRKLEILDLTDDHHITDKSVHNLAKLPSMERFCLHASGVTPAGVKYLNTHTGADVHGFNFDIGSDKDTAAVFQEIGD